MQRVYPLTAAILLLVNIFCFCLSPTNLDDNTALKN